MSTKNRYLLMLQTIFITCVVISPIVSVKLIALGFNIFDVPAAVTGSAFIYAFVFLVSNMISEIGGESEAKYTSIFGLVCQVVATILFACIGILPYVDSSVQAAYKIVLGSNIVFTVSGILTYLISQFCNIKLFSRLNKSCKNSTLANLISTVVSQLVDNIFFLGFSYGMFLGWIFRRETRIQLVVMILSQFVIRTLLSVVETPLFKLAVVKSAKDSD